MGKLCSYPSKSWKFINYHLNPLKKKLSPPKDMEAVRSASALSSVKTFITIIVVILRTQFYFSNQFNWTMVSAVNQRQRVCSRCCR